MSAHIPTVATFVVMEQADDWNLDVHMSTSGMHQFLISRFPGEALSSLAPAEYEKRLVEALREGISLNYDGEPAHLGEARVELAAHSSRVHFRLSAPPASARQMYATVDALNYSGNQNNVLRLKTAVASTHVVLSAKNEFRGSLELLTTARFKRVSRSVRKCVLRALTWGERQGLFLAGGAD